VRQAEVAPADCPPIPAADLPSQAALIAAFRERRSTRHFRKRPVPRELVETLIDAARWAPSASNSQSVAWLALDDAGRIGALGDAVIRVFERSAGLLRSPLISLVGPLALGPARFKLAQTYRSGLEGLVADHARRRDPIFHHAPVVLIAHSPAGSDLGRDDAIYQAYNIMLLAQRMGLGTCQIGFLTAALEIKIFGLQRSLEQRLALPAGRKAQAALVLGFPLYHFRRMVPRRQPVLRWNEG
jgi:nitroreductase